MSYDVYLTIDTGANEHPVVVEIGNMTSNVSPMWRKALPPDGIAGLHLKRCRDAYGDLRLAVEKMRATPGEYREMNPPNGWGNYEAALEYLDRLATAAREHPACTIEVSR